MSIKVTYTRGDGATSMLSLAIGSETLVADVAEQVFRADPTRRGSKAPSGFGVIVTPFSGGPEATPRTLESTAEFMSSGVRSGDHIEVVPASAAAHSSSR